MCCCRDYLQKLSKRKTPELWHHTIFHFVGTDGNILILSTVVTVIASVSMSIRVTGEVYVWKYKPLALDD